MPLADTYHDRAWPGFSAIAGRVVLPLLWLVTLGYQWAFASMVLDDVSQIMAWYFHEHPNLEPLETWCWLCDAYVWVMGISWALWLAACPRALTVILSREERQSWAQRRLARGVLFVALMGLAIQFLWTAALFRTHGTGVALGEYLFVQVLIRYESHLPWRHQIVALLPLVAWILVLIWRRRQEWNAYHWIAACWAAAVLIQMQLAYGLGQARMLADFSYENEERIATLGWFASIAIIVVAVVLEYRQVWQSALEDFWERRRAESAVLNP